MKTLVLIVGCHRSGTSAVAGCLAQMGVEFGEHLLPPAYDNPKGFFESRAAVTLHDQLFASVGASWDKPLSGFRLFPQEAPDWIAPIVRDLPGPICAVKDPRASIFVHLWAEACKREGVRLCVLEVRRDADANAASLEKREGWQAWRARRLLEDYAKAMAASADCAPRAVLHFPEDLGSEDAWRKAFTTLGLDLQPNMDAIAEFVEPHLIHHDAAAPPLQMDAPPLWTAIIPSNDDEKVVDCVASLIDAQPEIRPDQIAVVSDGLSRRTHWKLRGVRWVRGKKPFVFARAVNMGAAAADPTSDLVILGDDVQIDTPGALDRLACSSAGAAAIAPEVVGVCGQPAQRAGASATRADWLAFICAYIPRRAWNEVGPLDERFVGYGYDDVDWCRRAQDHGPLRIAHDVRVVHTHDSAYRNREDWMSRYAENRAIFDEKWAS